MRLLSIKMTVLEAAICAQRIKIPRRREQCSNARRTSRSIMRTDKPYCSARTLCGVPSSRAAMKMARVRGGQLVERLLQQRDVGAGVIDAFRIDLVIVLVAQELDLGQGEATLIRPTPIGGGR